ncbi:3-hydroxyacyl-CoA dehydrogenase family protein [Effusibacillus pohliae]|uniref:3-hydroxyacyl-CoA dehydrogenase family protein n=1 Tax=Effusibacillus pohliae TaxID=232270 RepID=UPI00037210B6|nr:3-hydroxyacyl-CoA dehydrogenase family protein [Effusibacillus pohliae]
MRDKTNVLVIGSGPFTDRLRQEINRIPFLECVDIQAVERRAQIPQIVIETTNVELERKQAHLIEIEPLLDRDALILSTTLAITATETAARLTYPHRLVGFGALGDWEQFDLIEIAPALQTDPVSVKKAAEFFESLGKQTETVADEAGLVFPRILAMIVNEAAFAWMQGVASVEDIDAAMRKGTNYPLGPLEWADQVGVDEIYAIVCGLYRNLCEDRYRPAPILRKMVHAGWLGKKTGRGFYSYS